MLDLVCLRSFVHVYESGTVAAAATGLGYTAPAVSQHLARLERDLGVPLFDRVAGRLRPTDHGIALQALAARLLDLEEQCHQLSPPTDRTVPVTIAGCASAITGLVIPRLAGLRRYEVTVQGLDDERALRALRLGQADVAIVQRYGDDEVELGPLLTATTIEREPLRLVLPPDRPAGTTLAQLDDPRWLLNGDDTACTRSALRLLARAGITPVVTGSMEDNHALLRLVAAGLGACIVPQLVLAAAGPAPDLTISTARLGAERTILAVTRAHRTPQHGDLIAALQSGASDSSSPKGRKSSKPRSTRTAGRR